MEPMTLGSPVGSQMQSPPLLQMNSSIQTNPTTYYPSFLLGDSQNSMSTRIPPGSISPGRPRQFGTSTSISSPNSPNVNTSMSKDSFFPNSTRLGSDRPGGPPTLSLMGSLLQSPSLKNQNNSFIEQQKIINSPHGSHQPISYNSPVAPHSGIQPLTPFTPPTKSINASNSVIYLNNQTNEVLEDSWVTVYGFPVSSASHILTQFAQLGTIVDHRQPGCGNWMHLKYQTKLQARKALTKNSKIFNGTIMIGVIPCSDTSIVGEKENLNGSLCSVMSPREMTPKSKLRPLTQAYQASRAEIEVTSNPSTPKKNDGLVARAMQHLLGI